MACENCEITNNDQQKEMEYVSFPRYIYEGDAARNEREKKRLWILVIISWAVTLLIVGIFTFERLQYDYTSTTTTEEIILDGGEGGNANYIGQDGNIYNGEDNNSQDNQNEDPNEEK